MDGGFWVLPALAGVVIVFLGPIGFFLIIGARGRLQVAERKIRELEAQLRVGARSAGHRARHTSRRSARSAARASGGDQA